MGWNGERERCLLLSLRWYLCQMRGMEGCIRECWPPGDTEQLGLCVASSLQTFVLAAEGYKGRYLGQAVSPSPGHESSDDIKAGLSRQLLCPSTPTTLVHPVRVLRHYTCSILPASTG